MDIGEKKGKYSVKSGYRVLLANSNPFAYGLDSSCWKKTWSMHVPAKVGLGFIKKFYKNKNEVL